MAKVYLAADHAGFALKGLLLEYTSELGYDAEDLGAFGFAAEDDYPDIVLPFARRVATDEGSLGIVIGGSGHGETMVANRVHGVRAATFYGPRAAVAPLEQGGGDSEDAYDIVRLARIHNNANVLSIGARFVSTEEAKQAVRIFLETLFSDSPRHERRLAKF